MKALLLGVGMQGKAALHDLARCDQVIEITAADRDLDALRAHVLAQGYGPMVRCKQLDASDAAAVDRLVGAGADVAIDLLPAPFVDTVAESAVRHGVHLVNTFYTNPALERLTPAAIRNGVTVLPEFGMDPGIDLVLLGEAVRSFDQVTDILGYGAGIPAPEAANNSLRYKISWTLEGVLRSYIRPARVIRDGRRVDIESTQIFRPEHLHHVELPGLGALEAYPNGDALRYADLLGVSASRLRTLGRYALRWPGHAAFWRTIADLHLLDDEPVTVRGHTVDRKAYLAAALEPHLRYGADEQDLAIVRVDVRGTRGGRDDRLVRQVIDRRALDTGLTAMSQLVGYTASIGAQMIATGAISKRGVLSPVTDVPYRSFSDELEKRGIHIVSENSDSG